MTEGPMDKQGKSVPATANAQAVEAFLRQAALAPRPVPGAARGRLVFAMDATASRGATWAQAQKIQAEMFKAVAGLGGLDIQLVFFRGMGECRASPWVSEAPALLRLMRQVECVGGHTQIERVLRHTAAEARESIAQGAKVNALVYVGDCLEESPDEVAGRAGELALLGVPIFAFQEGEEPRAKACFQDMARLTRGAYGAFDASSAALLMQLLTAVAVYAAGGYRALSNYAATAGADVRRLTSQLG
jgi:hypothetical protein